MCFNNILFEHTETRMNKKIKNPETDHLFQAILTLKNLDECYAFFEDVCTINELLSISQRFEVAKMLRDQKTYLDIAEKTGSVVTEAAQNAELVDTCMDSVEQLEKIADKFTL